MTIHLFFETDLINDFLVRNSLIRKDPVFLKYTNYGWLAELTINYSTIYRFTR